jgi:putative ABC transport system substrate-binding protein
MVIAVGGVNWGGSSMCGMKRREFLTLVGGAAAASVVFQSPLCAQQVYRVGFLSTGSGPAPGHEAFESSLASLGYQVGRNLVIERHYAAGDLGRLQALAGDLVRANVDVIVTDTTPSTAAAKRATARIPIVMAGGGDAVGAGLVASLARPGGNVTGMSALTSQLDGKKPELLRELKPDTRRLAFIGNSQIAAEQTGFREVQKTATALGMEAIFVEAPVPEAFELAFASIRAAKIDVGIVPPSAPNMDARHEIVRIAARSHLPVAYGNREFVYSGGLMSYGTSRASLFGRAAFFVDKILKGANAADLPVEQPTTFDLAINLTTAKALGLTIPESFLLRADEVIE